MNKTYFIVYVEDQNKTKMFYELLFKNKPIVDEPGMTEFELPDGSILGIMPIKSTKKLFGEDYYSKLSLKSLSKFELYFLVDNAKELHTRALQLGGIELRKFEDMDWGERAAYSMNHDGHILAFAEKIKKG